MRKKNYSKKLTKARELYGPHNTLAFEIGISPSTLQEIIAGKAPSQRRVIESIDNYIKANGL